MIRSDSGICIQRLKQGKKLGNVLCKYRRLELDNLVFHFHSGVTISYQLYKGKKSKVLIK